MILIVIDFWSDWCTNKNGGIFLEESFQEYMILRKNNCIRLIELLQSKNNHNIKIINADYSEGKWEVMKDPRIQNIEFDGDIKIKKNILKDKTVFICGSSFDQCLINRPLGYRNLIKERQHNKPKEVFFVSDCSWFGGNKLEPIDYVIKNIRGVLSKSQFKNLSDIINYERKFLEINKIKNISQEEIITRYLE